MKFIIILLIAIILTSCTNPLDKKYNDETLKDDAKEIIKSKKLKGHELRILGWYIINSHTKGIKLNELTYSEIQKNSSESFQDIGNFLAKEPSIEDLKRRDKFEKILTNKSSNIGYIKSKDNKYIVVDIVFENNSKKNIKAEIGSLAIPSISINDIPNQKAIFEGGIKPGELKKALILISLNQFDSYLEQLSFERREDVKWRWLPKKIIFEDENILE